MVRQITDAILIRYSSIGMMSHRSVVAPDTNSDLYMYKSKEMPEETAA